MPAQDFFKDRREIREVFTVIEIRKTICSDDTVDFLLCFALDSG